MLVVADVGVPRDQHLAPKPHRGCARAHTGLRDALTVPDRGGCVVARPPKRLDPRPRTDETPRPMAIYRGRERPIRGSAPCGDQGRQPTAGGQREGRWPRATGPGTSRGSAGTRRWWRRSPATGRPCAGVSAPPAFSALSERSRSPQGARGGAGRSSYRMRATLRSRMRPSPAGLASAHLTTLPGAARRRPSRQSRRARRQWAKPRRACRAERVSRPRA